MRTTKPISTISYNTEPFLIKTLDYLKKLHYITYYEFIKHQGDTDTKKPHIHLYIVPSKYLDLDKFKSYFDEPDPLKPNEPLACMFFRVSSSYGDWYWYGLHDRDYLKSKHLTRNVHYTDNDIYTCDKDAHIELVNENPLINFCNMSDVVIKQFVYDCVVAGYSLDYVLCNGQIPLGKVNSVIAFFNAISSYYSPRKDLRTTPVIPSRKFFKVVKQKQLLIRIRDIFNGSAQLLEHDPIF